MSSGWTPERRARQAAAIQRWQPWARATGPKTAEGKAIVAQNGRRQGSRRELAAIRGALRAQGAALRKLSEITDGTE